MKSYTLQIMYSDSKIRNYIIFRIRFGPLCCCNQVVKLALSQITQFIGCCVPFSLPLVLFSLDKVSKNHVGRCHQGAEHVTQVIIVHGTKVFNVFQIFLNPIEH